MTDQGERLPAFIDGPVTVYQGDVREVLAQLPAESVQVCVTSPPYWGLRDYGVAGQLGLEPTPEEYVANMVAVFREVRRVLRKDGTLWLNLGSSYGGGGNGGGGSFAKERPGWSVFGGNGPIQSPEIERAPAYGSDGTAPSDSRAPGSACLDLCDGCQAATQNRRGRTPDSGLPPELASPPLLKTARDTGPRDSSQASPDASPRASRESTPQRSEQPPPVECSHCANCGACLSVLRSSGRDARLCARRAGHNADTFPRVSGDRNQGTDAAGMAWVNYTRALKPKDMVPIPWMVAMALQADGWWLRSDIIWSKPNPMPESVADRPTKAHEYLFLLTKSPRYYYDADAIREPYSPETKALSFETMDFTRRDAYKAGKRPPLASTVKNAAQPPQNGHRRLVEAVKMGRAAGRPHNNPLGPGGANRRTVWEIATQPYPEAHFATFPEDLVIPCVKAGSREGDVALDPFAGSGTTLAVARRLGRRAVGIELNPAYVDLIRQRVSKAALPLLEGIG